MLYRLHTIAGVFVAPLIVVAALSGLLYAFAPSIESFAYRDELTATAGGPAHTVAEQAAAAQEVHPDLDLAMVEVSEDPTATTRVLFTDPTLPSSSYTRAVFVDPGDLAIKGDLVQYGSSHALPLRTWISQGHRNLWLGTPGRIYAELAASWLGALSLVGAALWWGWAVRRRKAKSSDSARNRNLSTHSGLGTWLLPGFLFFTVTGLTWSLVAGSLIGDVRTQLNWLEPKPAVSLSAGDAAAAASPHAEHMAAGMTMAPFALDEADRVVAAAREAGLKGLIDVKPPAKENTAWTVKEAREPYKLHNSSVSVDGATGEIVDTVDYSQWPLAAKLTNWLIQLHMGTLFGLANQIVLGIIALGLLAVTFAGYRMWFLRGRGRTSGRLPSPAGATRLSPRALAGWLAFLVVYSLIAPLFGISLVVFLLGDWAWRAIRGKKSPARKEDKDAAPVGN
ncbi:hypothetical protein B843_10895 [Corynebacterium vitaeruminis DSM 20294]|uniref:Iron-regulated membrane protein n=1 Tax=Corynebacterium vitaeruminis DSM 20294 TaxID=1224164 RepID=W5Y3S0_9CORY|nr:hypothetical protein B843_10895 [Corynebacterium vitaeruminis DSM 20294]